MANQFYNMLVFGLSVQLAAYVLWAFNFFGSYIVYPFGNAASMLNLQNTFTPDAWMFLITGVGIITGVVALLFRQGTYALYALLICAIGVCYKIVVPFLVALPNTIAALLPDSTNPFSYVNGVYVPNSGGINPIQVVVGIIVGFVIFIFIWEMVLQRKVS